ncbi:hypothetical protein SAMN05444162_3386 [Paenibacillaceae bacterium GAS479]|nr:hypothetical protein SAMN05444162_3386 [Paenibacillaceae bacterium GAS479]
MFGKILKGQALWIFGLGFNATILSKITTFANSLLLTIGFAIIIAGLKLDFKTSEK